MSTQQFISVTQCVVDAMDVVARLDGIGLRDDREMTLATLQGAEEEYAELVIRRNASSIPASDAVAFGDLMDDLRARLKFFAKRAVV